MISAASCDVIEVSGLRMAYDGFEAVRGIDLLHYLNGERMKVRFGADASGGSRVTISGAVAKSKHPLAADPDYWSEALGG